MTVTGRIIEVVSQNDSVCSGSKVNLTATATWNVAPVTYTWYPGGLVGQTVTVNPTSTTVYTVTANTCGGIDANDSAQATSTVKVFPNNTPSVTITVNPPGTICQGSNVTFTADTTNGNGGTNPSFQWQVNGANAGTNNQTFTTNTLKTGDVITVIMTSNAPCPLPATATSNPIAMTVYPAVTVTTMGDTTICAGQPVMVCATAANGTGGPYFYAWNNGGGNSNCANVSPLVTTVYLVSATDSCQSNPALDSVTVTVLRPPNPIFIFSPSDISILTPAVSFTDQSSGDVTPWFWDFGDSTTSNLHNPTHTYKTPGTYTVKLVVTNVDGCMDSITNTLVIHDEYFFYLPNSFTPNGDGINDFFGPQGTDALQALPLVYTMTIYNRWGERIFETDNTSLPWGGQANSGSKVAEAGVYVYLIRFQDSNYSDKQIVGSVTLIR